MMNPQIKTKWLAALRSGKYKQGKEKLRPTRNTYCCLGVLCDIAVKEGVTKWNIEGNRYSIPDIMQKEEGELPENLVEWAELDCSNPTIDLDSFTFSRTLAELNDKENYTFHQLADLIEEQL